MFHVIRLPVAQRTRNPQRQSVSVLPPSCQLCDDQVKVLSHGHTQSPLQLWKANLKQEHDSTLLPPEPHRHQHLSDRIHQLAQDRILHGATFLDTHIKVCFRTCDWAYG